MKMLVKVFPSLFVATILVGATGCQDKRLADLDQRIAQLEVKVKLLEIQRDKAADQQSQKESDFKICLQAANDDYFKDVKANGTRTKNGSYDLPVVTAREIERHKQQKIEECKLLYR